MITIAVIVIYIVVWYKASLIQAHRMNENHERKYPHSGLDDDDKMFNLLGAVFANAFWPIWLPLYFAFNHMLGKVPPTTKELQLRIAHQHRQIKELEEMLGIE